MKLHKLAEIPVLIGIARLVEERSGGDLYQIVEQSEKCHGPI